MNSDLEEQEDELLALQSIYGSDEFVRNESKAAGEIRVCVEVPAGFTVVLKDGDILRQYDISFLPPLLLNFELPGNYPSCSAPSFTLSCSWMTRSQLSALTAQLADLYLSSGGAVVLFSWVQFLREEALAFLEIHNVLELPSDEQEAALTEPNDQPGQNYSPPREGEVSQDDPESESDADRETAALENGLENISEQSVDEKESEQSSDYQNEGAASPPEPVHGARLRRGLTPSQSLLSRILIHQAEQKRKAFASSVFDCGVCFASLLGSECVQLSECEHVFCRACLAEFCKVQITEGNVRAVSCPQADCRSTPTPAQVRSLVGEELFGRYDRLLLQSTLDLMADVVYCPRRSCGSAVIREESSAAAVCSVCRFAFCVTCRKSYHGAEACNTKKNQPKDQGFLEDLVNLPPTFAGRIALLEDYEQGSKERKRLLERRYGRRILLYVTEETRTDEWLSTNSKSCPHCFTKIEKNGGCNMMTCYLCGQKFCWFCMARAPIRNCSREFDPPCASCRMYHQ